MKEFIKIFNPTLVLENEMLAEICDNSNMIIARYPKVVLSALQTQENIYFIKEGVVRRYTVINDHQITNWFFGKGDFALSEESFLYGEKSKEYLETTGPAMLIEIKKMDFARLSEKYTGLREIFKDIHTKYLIQRQEHYNMTAIKSSVETYKWFLSHHTYIYRHIKLQHLASFLRITEQSLSRIRSSMQTDDKLRSTKI